MNIRSAAVPPWVFRATLPFGVLMMLGELMPLSLRLAVRFAIDAETRSRLARLPAAPDDAELAAKVARQFRRIALFASGVVTAMVLSDFLRAAAAGPLDAVGHRDRRRDCRSSVRATRDVWSSAFARTTRRSSNGLLQILGMTD